MKDSTIVSRCITICYDMNTISFRKKPFSKMDKSALEKLIDIESRKIIKDLFEYLPIRGLLTQVIQFSHLLVAKREWKIEKVIENKDVRYPVNIKNRYPVNIKDLTQIYKKAKNIDIIFNISDQAFFDAYDNGIPVKYALPLSYEIFCRFYIGNNFSEYDHVHSIHLHMWNIKWNTSNNHGFLRHYYDDGIIDSCMGLEMKYDENLPGSCPHIFNLGQSSQKTSILEDNVILLFDQPIVQIIQYPPYTMDFYTFKPCECYLYSRI